MEEPRASKRVYLALAMDAIPAEHIRHRERRFQRLLRSLPVKVLTTFNSDSPLTFTEETMANRAKRIVEDDLSKLKVANLLLADLSLPDHVYIGCICEIVYAHQMKIPVVVYVGRTGLDERTWLVYHADSICTTMNSVREAVRKLLDLD